MTYHYAMIIQWSNEDNTYIASLPEFPICLTHGATYEEAAHHAQEVLELLVEEYQAQGKRLPEPIQLQPA